MRFIDGCHCRPNPFPRSNMSLDAEPSFVPGAAEPAPAGWWWSARRCPRCSHLVLERITPRADAVVAVHQIHCRTCSWSETTPV